jgi:hypothetical protein
MPTETLSPATRAMLRRAGDALPGSIPAEEEQATMTALAMTGLMIAESDKAQSAILSASLAVLVDFARSLESAVGTGREYGVDEERETLQVAFMKILMSPRPDLLADRFMRVCAAVRKLRGAWAKVNEEVDFASRS